MANVYEGGQPDVRVGAPPTGRDRSLAYTHLEDAVMRAVRALTA